MDIGIQDLTTFRQGEKRKRHDSDSEDDRYDKYCAICKAKGGLFWTHDTEDCRTLVGFKKKKQRATHGMTKKDFHEYRQTFVYARVIVKSSLEEACQVVSFFHSQSQKRSFFTVIDVLDCTIEIL